jgi:hypothetical protein
MFSVWHWLIVIIVGAVIALSIMAVSVSRVRRILFNLAERRVYIGRETPLEEPSPGRIALPYLLIFWTLAILVGLTLAPTVDLSVIAYPAEYAQRAPTASLYGIAINVLTPLCLIAALVVHFRPNHSRQLKYCLVMACIPLMTLLFMPSSVLDAIRKLMVAGKEVSITGALILLGLAFWDVVLVVIISVVGGAWVRNQVAYGNRSPAPWEQYLFAFVRMRWAGPIIILCSFLSKSVMLLLLITRYVAIERFRYRPVIYLRSFRYERAAEVLGSAIAPAVAPFGVLKGLVHGQQTGSTLMSKASIWQFGLMATVPDAHWQDWVTKALRTASLVIIDCSVLTASVIWEVGQALLHVNRQRVLIITSENATMDPVVDTEIVRYGNGVNAISKLRADLATWAQSTVSGDLRAVRYVTSFAWIIVLLVVCTTFALEVAGEVETAFRLR